MAIEQVSCSEWHLTARRPASLLLLPLSWEKECEWNGWSWEALLDHLRRALYEGWCKDGAGTLMPGSCCSSPRLLSQTSLTWERKKRLSFSTTVTLLFLSFATEANPKWHTVLSKNHHCIIFVPFRALCSFCPIHTEILRPLKKFPFSFCFPGVDSCDKDSVSVLEQVDSLLWFRILFMLKSTLLSPLSWQTFSILQIAKLVWKDCENWLSLGDFLSWQTQLETGCAEVSVWNNQKIGNFNYFQLPKTFYFSWKIRNRFLKCSFCLVSFV